MTADRQSEQLCFFETHFTTERSIEPVKTIALANQKGGVGKTTTAASLGIGLSRQGKKVLLIDADAQGNLTQMLGWPQPDELSPTLSTLMEKIIAEQPIAPSEGILHHSSGVHLVPANIELSALEVTLVNTMSRETVLRQYLSTVAERYDYALIDCMPSLGTQRKGSSKKNWTSCSDENENSRIKFRFWSSYFQCVMKPTPAFVRVNATLRFVRLNAMAGLHLLLQMKKRKKS